MRALISRLAIVLLCCALQAPVGAQYSKSNPVVLLTAAAATGSAINWPGGIGIFEVAGTFGGATISLQFLGPDGTTWITAGTGTTFTAANGGIFYLPPGPIRATVTGGAGVSVTATAVQIPDNRVPPP